MNCPKCNAELNPETTVCPNCGTPVQQGEQEVQQQTSPQQPGPLPPQGYPPPPYYVPPQQPGTLPPQGYPPPPYYVPPQQPGTVPPQGYPQQPGTVPPAGYVQPPYYVPSQQPGTVPPQGYSQQPGTVPQQVYVQQFGSGAPPYPSMAQPLPKKRKSLSPETKRRIIYVLLGISTLGLFGVHDFYVGKTRRGIYHIILGVFIFIIALLIEQYGGPQLVYITFFALGINIVFNLIEFFLPLPPPSNPAIDERISEGRVVARRDLMRSGSMRPQPPYGMPPRGYAQPGYGPFAQPDPKQKSRFTYQLLSYFLGGFGVGDFYAGRIVSGIIHVLLLIVQCLLSYFSIRIRGGDTDSFVLALWIYSLIVGFVNWRIWALVEIVAVNTDGKGKQMK